MLSWTEIPWNEVIWLVFSGIINYGFLRRFLIYRLKAETRALIASGFSLS